MKASEWVGRWSGRTVVCIASGPSLTETDCETAHASGHPVIVTNTTFKLCPWADVLFAHDSKWWREYRTEVDATFAGARVTVTSQNRKSGIHTTYGQQWFKTFGNSGACAVSLAVAGGAAKVVMLGFDCQKTGGKTHWHGDHGPGLTNAKSMPLWPKKFAQLAAYAKAKKCRVVNASRETALTCFERVELADEL